MPIYEYRCRGCGRVSSLFTRAIGEPVEPACPQCHSREMQRRISPFAVGKSVQSVHQQFPSSSGQRAQEYYSDPRNIGRHTEENFARYGLEMPQSVRETIDAAREGELPRELDL